MLRILCGEEPENLLNTATMLFKLENKTDWFNDSLVEEMVLDIDKTRHVHDKVFESPVLGTIVAQQLSGGVKGLILILKSDYLKKGIPMRSSIFGDNCVKWLVKLSYMCDFSFYMSHFLDFKFGGDFSDKEFKYTPINAISDEGVVLTTCGEIIDYYISDLAKRPSYEDLNIPELDSSLQKPRSLEETVGTHEYYMANKEDCPYLVDATDPIVIQKMAMIDKMVHSRSKDELDSLNQEYTNLFGGKR